MTEQAIAVVTGGAGGMGLPTAKILGRDHRVVISDVNQAKLETAACALRACGVDVLTLRCDITDRRSVEALVTEARALGRVASVVHTAGLSPEMGSAERIIRTNAVGTVHVAEAFAPFAEDGFALINVASVAGHLLPAFLCREGQYELSSFDLERMVARMVAHCSWGSERMRSGFAYALSKNFVLWYTKRLAMRYGARGARVVSVSPGSFDTEMGRLERATGSAHIVDYAAIKRFGRPEEVAELLAFCASAKAGYLTGADILCDGGTMAGLGLKERMRLAWSIASHMSEPRIG